MRTLPQSAKDSLNYEMIDTLGDQTVEKQRK